MKKFLTAALTVVFAISISFAESADPDGGWPRLTTSEAGTKILLHQPQIESWKDQQILVAWAVVEVLIGGKSASEMGVIKLEAQTSVAMEERLVNLENIRMSQVNFPTLDQTRSRDVVATLTSHFPKEGVVIALDRILAAVDKSVVGAAGVPVNQKPPPIFYSKRPAVLVQFDGEPIVSPIKDSVLKFMVNTNWDIFFDPDKKMYYLRNGKNWFSSETLEKDWAPTKKLPKSFETLPKDPNWDDIRANMPPKGISKGDAPTIFVSMEPAELIVTKGKPKKERVEKSKLYWIKNTECDVFQMKKGAYYFLVSGRWFRADKLEGPWTFATPDLPTEFQNIPRTHPRARVRASVPGTDEATEAVLLAQVPQTLTISRDGLQSPDVKYQSDPEFKEIKGTQISYATNTMNDVLKVGGLYYLCFQGAWFRSDNPAGPWVLAESVPDEIYKIPSDSPMYHVTYVRIKSVNKESVTYVETSGYSGVTVSFGVAMYGTGWYYPPYYYGGGYYPVYYPYGHSYGSYAVYNSRTGAYGYGSSVSGPHGGISHAATYNPNTGTYARGTAAYGPSGSRASGQAYNPRTGTSLTTKQGRNDQGSWGTSKVQRGDSWAQTGHVKTDQGSVRGVKTSEGDGMIRAKGENGSGFVGKKGDDIYAGKDGNVYKKTEDGWQKRTEGGWSDVDRGQGQPKAGTRDQVDRGQGQPKAGTRDQVNRDQLSRDATARQQGNQRVQSSNSQSGASSRGSSGSRSGSYGGGGGRSGGGSRGGGGGRRR